MKEDDDDKEEMEGKRRYEENIQDSLVVQEGSPCFKGISNEKKLNNHMYRYTKTHHHELPCDSQSTRSPATHHPALFSV